MDAQKHDIKEEPKACETCVANFQKYEETKIKLSEKERKTERLEIQIKNQKSTISEQSESVENL